jgi:WD40 repeat protein
MKKLIIIVLSMFIILGTISCGQRKQSPPKEEQSSTGDKKEAKLDKKEGEELLNSYVKALILKDASGIPLFYSQNLKVSSGNFKFVDNPHPNGFKIDTLEDKEGKLEGKVVLLSVSTGQPYFSSDESKFTIIKEKGSYVIDKIEPSKFSEVTEKDKVLFMNDDGDVKGKEILKLDEVPRYATPQGGAMGQKFSIGRDGFGPIAGDAEGKKLAVSTTGQYPTLMVTDIKEKQVKPLDLFFDESIQSIAWSQDGKHLAVEMANPSGARYIYVYDAEKGSKIDDPMKNVLKPAKYSVNTPYWISGNELVFNVTGVSTLAPDEQKNTGTYKFDVKNTSLTKF